MTDPPFSLNQLLQTHGLSFDTAPPLEKWQSMLRVLAEQISAAAPQWQQSILELQWPIFMTDSQGLIKTWNVGCEKMFGYQSEMLGQPLQKLLPSLLEGVRLKGLLRQALAGERLVGVELRYVQADGTTKVMMCHISPLPNEGAEADIIFTCTSLGEQESAGRTSHDFYESLLNALPAPVAIFDTDQRYVFCNAAAINNPEIREWIIGKNDSEYVKYRSLHTVVASEREYYYAQAINEKRTITFEEEFRTPEGETLYQLRTFTPIYAPDGSLLMNIGHGLDITSLKRAEQALTKLNDELERRVQERTAELEVMSRQLHHDAFHDSLTGLPNRSLFSECLEKAICRATREDTPQYAVLFLDTDRFKGINDTLGHPAGDQLLRELAARLRRVLRASDTVARLGGDEFAILLEPLYEPERAAQVAKRIQEVLRAPIALLGYEATVSVSIGIVLGDSAYDSAAAVMRDVDIAMYRAKAAGRDGYQIFTQEMRLETIAMNLLDNELRAGLKRGELRVFYQSIVSLPTMQVTGFEALVRWQHPHRGLLGPSEFIHMAEDSGLLLEIDRWVLREACLQMQAWHEAHPQEAVLQLSVNFSGRHFAVPGLAEHVAAVLNETHFDPQFLNLEITESAIMDKPQTMSETLSRLRALGLQLHLDDFGTGYSSLSYLQTYPLTTLKIDRSFVMGMLDNPRSAELVRTIIAMAKNMRLCVVAEGIETREQLRAVQELGCEYGQGYFLAKPLELSEAHKIAASLSELNFLAD